MDGGYGAHLGPNDGMRVWVCDEIAKDDALRPLVIVVAAKTELDAREHLKIATDGATFYNLRELAKHPQSIHGTPRSLALFAR